MKIRLEKAVMMSEPNRPNPLSHDNSRRRVIASPLSSSAGFTGVFILVLLFRLRRWRVDQLFHVGPEHLVLGVFQVSEVVLLYGEYEYQHRPDSHAQTGDDGEPRKFHLPRLATMSSSDPGASSFGDARNPDWFLVQAIQSGGIRLSLQRKTRHGSRSQNVHDRSLGLGPNLVSRAPHLSLARRALLDALVQPDRALDRLDYIQQGYAGRRNGQGIASARAALRANEAGAHQLLQDLRQEVPGNICGFRQLGLPHAGTWW